MKSIASLGPEGTFSAILARQRFGADAEYFDCGSINGIFDRVVAGEASLGTPFTASTERIFCHRTTKYGQHQNLIPLRMGVFGEIAHIHVFRAFLSFICTLTNPSVSLKKARSS